MKYESYILIFVTAFCGTALIYDMVNRPFGDVNDFKYGYLLPVTNPAMTAVPAAPAGISALVKRPKNETTSFKMGVAVGMFSNIGAGPLALSFCAAYVTQEPIAPIITFVGATVVANVLNYKYLNYMFAAEMAESNAKWEQYDAARREKERAQQLLIENHCTTNPASAACKNDL